MADRSQGATPSPADQVRALYEQAESNAARSFEEAVARPSFGKVMALSAENVAALTRIGSDAADLLWRNLRIAGRADVTRLARQLHRTEDKLERLLQEVERLRDELAADRVGDARAAPAAATQGKAAAPPGQAAAPPGKAAAKSAPRAGRTARSPRQNGGKPAAERPSDARR